MPRYNCLDTEVQLYTWDPLSRHPALLKSSNPATPYPTGDAYPTFGLGPGTPTETLISNGGVAPCDASRSHKVKRVTEEYFKGCEGLDFLGCDAPFFLIHAGNDPLDGTPSVKPWTDIGASPYQDQVVTFGSSQRLIGSQSPAKSSALAKGTTGISCLNSRINEGNLYQNDSHEIDLSSNESSLSSLSSTAFRSPHAGASRSEEPKIEIEGQTTDSKMIFRATTRIEDNMETPFQTAKLESMSKPIKVVVKLSEKSFISPIFGADTDLYDICINVFFNGELNASQVVRYSEWAADEKNIFEFCGRRIETCREIPWIIITKSQEANSSTKLVRESPLNLTPSERWNKLTEMLLLEASEWGRDDCGYRCPTGKYLEQLSRKDIPSELDSSPVTAGIGFGVIDVVITLGRFSHLDITRDISSPHRNIPANSFQKPNMLVGAPIESRAAAPPLVTVTELSTEASEPPNLSNSKPSEKKVNFKNNPVSSSMFEMSHAVADLSNQRDKISSSVLQVAIPTTAVIHQSADSRTAVRRATSVTARIPTALTIVPIPRPPHPYRPENVPQKRYRGSEPALPPSPPLKRQKTANLFEELPFDLNTATYMSTRARRSASLPFAQIPPKAQPESVTKRKRSINQAKSASSNAASLEMLMAVAPSTPKKDKTDNPKTPESGSPLRKQARSSNYNPKLSNRPQNLRRKNSAGEWIIPPSRKNSAGEWETPTKGGQAKVTNISGGGTDGMTPEKPEKIFQPVFTSSADNISQNIAIELPTVGSPMNQGNIMPKENDHPSIAAGQLNELAIPAKATEITNVAQNTRCQNVRNTQNRELLDTSIAKGEAAAVSKYLQRKQKDGTFAGVLNKPQRKPLLIRFIQDNMNSAGEPVGNGFSGKIPQAQRSITSEHAPAPATEKKAISCPLIGKLKLKFSAFATGPQGDKVTDVLTDSALKATAQSRRKSGTTRKAELDISNNSVVATLRDSRVGTLRQPQTLDIIQPRPRFEVPNPNSRVVRLVYRQEIAAKMNEIKQEAPGTFIQAVKYNPMNEKIGTDTTRDPYAKDAGNSLVLATHNNSQDIPQDAGPKLSAVPQSVNVTCIDSVTGSATTLDKANDTLHYSDSMVQTVQEAQASTQLIANTAVPKRPFRPRTVGSIELKALLESHDHGNVVNTPLGAPLGMMHSQLMTRASRKAISFKPGKANDPSEGVIDRQVSSDKLTIKLPITLKSSSGKGSTSGKPVETTAIAALVQDHMKDADGGASKGVDAPTNGKADSDGSIYGVKKPISKSQPSATPKITTTSSIPNDLSLLAAGELSLNNKPGPQRIKKVISNRQKGPKTPAGTRNGLEEEAFKPTGKREPPSMSTCRHPLNKSVSYYQKGKEAALQASTGNEMGFKEAAEEVVVALKQVGMAKREIDKAAGDLQSLITIRPAQGKSQVVAVVDTTDAGVLASNAVDEPVTAFQGEREQYSSTPSALASSAGFWKPSRLCDDSILTYAKDQNWDGLERSPVTGQMSRQAGKQEEGCFRTFGVLMGVRYVVVGSAVVKNQ